MTTDLRKECTSSHTGTSAAAPIAAGIFALLLERKYVTILITNFRFISLEYQLFIDPAKYISPVLQPTWISFYIALSFPGEILGILLPGQRKLVF